MAMPQFTAEAALYRARGQYRTSMLENPLPTSPSGLINPARDEVIEVHSCLPGWSDIGGSCWPNPMTESLGGGGGDPGMPGDSGEVGEPHGGGKPGDGGKPPKNKPAKPPRYTPTEGGKCYANKMRNGETVFVERGRYTQLPGGIWNCCDTKSPECILCQLEGDPLTNCVNGWPL